MVQKTVLKLLTLLFDGLKRRLSRPFISALVTSRIIVILLSRNKKRAKKRRKFNVSWLLCIIQTRQVASLA